MVKHFKHKELNYSQKVDTYIDIKDKFKLAISMNKCAMSFTYFNRENTLKYSCCSDMI